MAGDARPFHLKYRPTSLDELVGNEDLKETLSRNLGVVHAYMFHGPKGCGKTTLARIVAGMLGVGELDLMEVNAAHSTGVDEARSIESNCYLRPVGGDKKMYVIDETHRFTKNAQDCMLKLLEEPPQHVYFALCTTEPDKVLATIKNRCVQYRVKTLGTKQVMRLLSRVVSAEGLEVDGSVLKSISKNCEGTPRTALMLLDKVKGVEDRRKALRIIEEGVEENKSVVDLCRVLMRPGSGKWDDAREVLAQLRGEDPEGVRRAVLGYMQAVLLNGNLRAESIMEEFWYNYYDTGFAGLVLSVSRACRK